MIIALTLCTLVAFAAPAVAVSNGIHERPTPPGPKPLGAKRVIVGNGTLYAKGSGAAMLFGTGNVTLKGVGMLLVAGENFQISVEGDGNVWTFGCVKIYKGNGTAHVEGTDVFILAKVRNGTLLASGEGIAILRGRGNFEPQKW